MPALPSPTPPNASFLGEPESISFTELNENPLAYLNQSIVVTGEYLPLNDAECSRISGPDIRWALTAENLQLDVVGYERIVELVPAGTTMTVQGIWRLYQGYLGCGKAPPRGSMWYLDIKKIVQPNPLVGKGGQRISVEIIADDLALPAIMPTEIPAADSVPTQTAVPTSSADSLIPSPTVADQIIPTATPSLPNELTPSPTISQSPATATIAGTQDPNVPVPPTSDAATLVPTNSPDLNTPTLTAEAPPALATATQDSNGGYPGPDGTPTATPTATLNPYP